MLSEIKQIVEKEEVHMIYLLKNKPSTLTQIFSLFPPLLFLLTLLSKTTY